MTTIPSQSTTFSSQSEQNQVLSALLSTGSSHLERRLQVVQLATNETIYNEGSRVNHVYFPLDSVASSVAVLSDGSTVEISMAGNDSIVGLSAIFGSRTSQHWMRMCLGGRMAKIEIEDLILAFNENKTVSKILLQTYSTLVTQISQRSVCHARHSVMERFCCWLLMIDDRANHRSLQLTQELVASRLGIRRAGVTVAARLLLEEGAVEYHRGHFRIEDRELVKKHACECYSVMKPRSRSITELGASAESTRNVVLSHQPVQRLVPRRMNEA